MKTIEIKVGEVGRILDKKEPAEHYDVLRQLFLDRFGIDIERSAAKGSGKSTLEESSSSSESDTLCLSPEQKRISSSDESLTLSSDDSGSEAVSHRAVLTSAKINEKENCTVGDYSISFSGGSLFKIKSNKDNIWIVCIEPQPFASGGAKEVHRVKWLLSCQKDGFIHYKEVPNKYVLSLFNRNGTNQAQNEKRLIEEVDVAHTFYPRTKRLFSISESGNQNQYGFLTHDLGESLFDTVFKNKYSVDTRIEITFSLIRKIEEFILRYNKVHLDLKPENICVNKRDIYLIDFDSVVSFDKKMDKIVSYTEEYLNKFLFDREQGRNKIDFLKKGHYQILQSVSALVETCAELIKGSYTDEDREAILPEEFYKQVEEYFLTHRSEQDWLYGEFKEEMEKIKSYFEYLEKSEFEGAAPEELRQNTIVFVKEIFESLRQHLAQLRFKIAAGFADEVLKFERNTLKQVASVFMNAEKDIIYADNALDDIQKDLDDVRNSLQFGIDTLNAAEGDLNAVDGSLGSIDAALEEATPELLLVNQALSSVRKYLNSVDLALGDVNSSLGEANKYLPPVKEFSCRLMGFLEEADRNLSLAKRKVEQSKAAVKVAKKVLGSICNSLDSEKNELDFAEKDLNARQEALDSLQAKVSEYKQEVQGWIKEAEGSESDVKELGSRARELESLARELESEFEQLENKATDSAQKAVEPVQGEKLKRKVRPFQFWSESCSPQPKRIKETLPLEANVRLTQSEP